MALHFQGIKDELYNNLIEEFEKRDLFLKDIPMAHSLFRFVFYILNPIPPGLLEGGAAWGGGGGRRKVPAAYNSKIINDNEMKLGGVVKDH